ncbi:MAG: lipopolysaccharide kinase InaA family protein [Halioglobus sp.]
MMRIQRGDSWAEKLRQLLLAASTDVPTWMKKHTTVLKQDTYSQVGLLDLDGRLCYLKYYAAKSSLQRLFLGLGYGRGVKSFDAARALSAAGISVPEPLACLAISGGVLLLTEGVTASTDLKSYWTQHAGDNTVQEDLACKAGLLMADLHRAGFAHGDFKWSNLLLSRGAFYLVDLEAVGRAKVGDGKTARDIARFTLNAEDMAMQAPAFELFLVSYQRRSGLSRPDLLKGVGPILRQLRARHVAKYGERGHCLLEC